MKAIAVAALLGLSLSLDVKKDLGHAIHDAGDVASIVSTGSKIAGLIMEDEFKVNGQKVLQDAGDAAKIIGTGIDIASHFAFDIKKDIGDAVHDAGDVASIVSTGSKIAGLIMEDELKINKQKALNDAGDVAKIIGTGLSIADHLYVENGENAEELLNIKKIGQDIGKVAKVALPIAGSLIMEDNFKINGQKILDDASKVAGIIGTGLSVADHLADDELKINKQKALNDAGDVAKIVGTGLKIADHLFVENGENAEELLNIKKIGQDIGKVAKVALPIAGSLIMEDNFKINGQKALDDASKVASVIGTGLSIADHLYVENGENAEELLNIKKIGQDIGKVAKVALPIAGSLIMEDNFKINGQEVFDDVASAILVEDNFKVNGQKVLDDASKVAGVIGTGLKIADHFAFFETESGEEKGFLSF